MVRSARSAPCFARPAAAAQRGGFILGAVVGLLVGLAVALGVALWVTKVPVPFVNKVPQRTAEQDAAEAERNRNWDPNAPLANKQVPRIAAPAASAAAAAAASAPAAATPPATGLPSVRDPAAILAGRAPTAATSAASAPSGAASQPVGADPFVYFVQAGAYVSPADAEQQRARLAMMGLNAKITEREQSGRTMHRVRVGPFDKRDLADAAKGQLDGAGIESVLVRVQRAP